MKAILAVVVVAAALGLVAPVAGAAVLVPGGPPVAVQVTTPGDVATATFGDHVFAARAADAAGNVDPTPASYAWTVQ